MALIPVVCEVLIGGRIQQIVTPAVSPVVRLWRCWMMGFWRPLLRWVLPFLTTWANKLLITCRVIKVIQLQLYISFRVSYLFEIFYLQFCSLHIKFVYMACEFLSDVALFM